MSKELNDILKEEVMTNIGVFESDETIQGKKSKVYPKIGGIKNIGRTYFTSQSEVNEKSSWAKTQMTNKYGSEMYGKSAQQAGQTTSKVASATATGNANSSSLISCTVNTFLVVPQKFVLKEKSNVGFSAYSQALQDLIDFLESSNTYSKEDWVNSHKESLNIIKSSIGALSETNGPDDKTNKNIWKKLDDTLKNQLGDEIKADKTFSQKVKNIYTGHKSWTDGESNSNLSDDDPKNAGKNIKGWDPNLTFKIDISTNFDSKWYTRKFKSGLLNKALMAIKTSARSYDQQNGKTEWSDHKYTADEMLPQDERKLNSIQWKMTNKIAKDFIMLLLGWSRKKQKTPDGLPFEKSLTMDTGFGKKMASKALDDRGILGRIKQNLFGNQQNNNTISVVFQLADPFDGTWEVVEEQKNDSDKAPEIDSQEGGDNGDATQTTESIQIDSFDMCFDESSTLKLVSGDVYVESDRYVLVKDICQGDSSGIDRLIDNCILGEKYR